MSLKITKIVKTIYFEAESWGKLAKDSIVHKTMLCLQRRSHFYLTIETVLLCFDKILALLMENEMSVSREIIFLNIWHGCLDRMCKARTINEKLCIIF